MSVLKIKNGNTWESISVIKGDPGDNYVLTGQDKQDIANLVDIPVDDVQINGTSIIENGVANIPLANSDKFGVVKINGNYGIQKNSSNLAVINRGNDSEIKIGTNSYKPIVPYSQHQSVFYGLAKAASDTTQSASSNTVGNYTDEAKASIQNMLGITDKYSPKEWMAESETELVTNAHSVGDLFYIGETLYKVIADLNAGDAINVGVNVEEVNVNNILDDYATKEDVQNNVSIIEKSASGAMVSFDDGADDIPLKELIVDINPVQDLHGYDSPWVGGGGVNKWDEQWEVGLLTWTGADATGTNRIRSKNYIPVAEGETYRVVTSNNLQFFYYDSSKAFVSYESSSKANGSTITIPTGCAYLRFYTYGTPYGEVYKNDIAINYPSTVTTYSPYENLCPISGWTGMQLNANGTVIPISWQTETGTVYGGSLDVLRGVLTVDKASFKVSDVAWTRYSTEGKYKFYHRPSNIKAGANTGTNGSISSAYPAVPFNDLQNTPNTFSDSANSTGRISVHDSEYTNATVEEFVAGRADVRFVYPLATPITVQLSPTEVKSLLGQNNIFADTGDTEVKYFSQIDKDLIDYIETSLKPYAKEEKLNDYVSDVQVNGNSIVENNVANVPIATQNVIGALYTASEADGKVGTHTYRAIVPKVQHSSVFYGLAKAAGVDMASSSNAVGTYTESAKSAISDMLNGAVQVSGTDPTIVAKSGIRYVCGEVLSLNFTPSANGICDVMFTSGSTPTVLTLPNTVKMPEWFIIEANMTYEINIADGIYGAVTSWTV